MARVGLLLRERQTTPFSQTTSLIAMEYSVFHTVRWSCIWGWATAVSVNSHTADRAKCNVQGGTGHASMQNSLWPAETCCSYTATRSGCSTAPRSTVQPQDMHCQPSLPSRQAHNAVPSALFKVYRLSLVTLHCDNAVCHQLSHESSSRPIMSGQTLSFDRCHMTASCSQSTVLVNICKASLSPATDVSSDMQSTLQCMRITCNLGPQCNFCHHCQQADFLTQQTIPNLQ